MHGSRKRESGDYDDFFVVSREEAEEQLQSAETVLKAVHQYLEMKQETEE